MRISQLAERTGVPVATLKFYLRDGLLPPGRSLSRTQADYDDTHVERVRLIRALTDVGGLSLQATRRVLHTLDDGGVARDDLLAAAQGALVGFDPSQVPDDDPSTNTVEPEPGSVTSRAAAWIEEMGWTIAEPHPLVDDLDRAWAACDAAGLGLDEGRLTHYAQQVEQIARIDLASVPDDPERAVRQVVLGTVLLDPVLATLRRLAHQHLSLTEPDHPSATDLR